MSSARYIEVDSTYRNRKEWPNPAEFEVLISQSGRKDKSQANDMVSLSAPFSASWTGAAFNKLSSSPKLEATVNDIESPTGAAGDYKTTLFLKTASPGMFQKTENYYVGAVANSTGATQNVASRITSYTYLGPSQAQITLESSISLFSDSTILIVDPTHISTSTDLDFYQVFIPNGRTGFNAYPGYILWNETKQSGGNILSYDTNTKIARVSKVANWNVNDKFSIRKQAPAIFGQLNNSTGAASSTIFSLPSTFSDCSCAYAKCYIKVGDELRLIVSYTALTFTLTAAQNNGTIIFPANTSNVTNFYKNMYIQKNTEVRKIIEYTVTGDGIKTATIDSSFSSPGIAGDTISIKSGSVDIPLPTDAFTNGANFEIFCFSYDNHNPFVYTGSVTSQQETSCYQIELMDIILPNKILNCGFGSRIAFYPYLYVELSNISGSSSGTRNAIYSNNPNAVRAVFRVPIYDVQNPIASAFVKLDGDGMIQTLKFKSNDNIFFSVRLPNGELFKTLEAEKYSPYEPNPDIQISALFSFKKL